MGRALGLYSRAYTLLLKKLRLPFPLLQAATVQGLSTRVDELLFDTGFFLYRGNRNLAGLI